MTVWTAGSHNAALAATHAADAYQQAVNDHCANVRRWVRSWRELPYPWPHEVTALPLAEAAAALADNPIARASGAGDLEAAWLRYRAAWARHTQGGNRG